MYVWLLLFCATLFSGTQLRNEQSTIKVQKGTVTVKNQVNLSTGQIVKSSQGVLEGTVFNLNNVILKEQNGFVGTINGTYNPNTNNLAIENNSLTPDQISQISKSISLKGQSSLEGLPGLFDSNKKLSVADAASILQVAIDSGLKTNLVMNGGKVVALKDLKFADGKKPTGRGIVELASASLVFGGKDLTFGDFLKFINASDIVFNSKITLTSEWVFTGSGLVTGNGNILDISQGGTIRINRNSQLYLSNLKLKGLGLGKIIFDDNTAKLLLSNVEIEMNRDYTFTQGGIYAEGPTVVMAKNYIWQMGLTSSMTVDGIAFMYDTSTFTDQKNIRPLAVSDPNNRFLTLLNDGIVYRRSNLDLIDGTSNALLYLTKNNSNAIIKNTQDITNNSNAIVSMGAAAELVRTTSNALLFCCKNTSNTLLYLNNNNSNAIVKNTQDIRVNSNALLFGDKNNSNTLLYLNKNNSNTLLYLNRVNSNAMLYLVKNLSDSLMFLTKNNSNAIVWLDTQMHTIDHGPLDHEVVTTTTHMIFDIYLSREHHMNVHTSTVIDGHGHVINFAKNQPNVLNVDAGCNLELTNVVLRNYEDASVALGAGASVVFGDGTRIELQETPVQLERDWTFAGDARVEGLATQLTVEPYNIVVLPNSALVLGDIDLVGLKQNNIRCGGDTSLILLRNIAMHMTHDYSFTSGTLQFEQDIVMTGTGTFTLGTNMVSTILENSSFIVDGPTFSYAPSIVDRDLLAMTDETSRLILLGSILDSSTAGLRLTTGTLKVDHINYIRNTGALLPSEGISLGNGVADDDLHIEMLPGGSLEVLDGILTYENVN